MLSTLGIGVAWITVIIPFLGCKISGIAELLLIAPEKGEFVVAVYL